MGVIPVIVHLTIQDAKERRILAAALAGGVGFLAVFLTGLYFANREMSRDGTSFVQHQATLVLITMVGIYAANMLTLLLAVLLPVDALSGEIESGVMQTIASKPVARSSIVVGKWLGYLIIVIGYLMALAAIILAAGAWTAGHRQIDMWGGLALMALEVTLLVSWTIAGGARFGSVANGVVALGYFGIGFIGGWMEQIGGFVGLRSARDLGIAISLVSPADAIWRMAAYQMMPSFAREIVGEMPLFAAASVPNARMVYWALAMIALVLLWGVRTFNRRAL
jgi:Cu-processing system permease protein